MSAISSFFKTKGCRVGNNYISFQAQTQSFGMKESIADIQQCFFWNLCNFGMHTSKNIAIVRNSKSLFAEKLGHFKYNLGMLNRGNECNRLFEQVLFHCIFDSRQKF